MRDLLLLTHFSGLIVGAGSAFAIFVIGFLSKRFPETARLEVLVQLFPLRYISYIGLLVLVASGVHLLLPYWSQINDMPLAIGKLIAVGAIVLLSAFGTVQMQIAKKRDVKGCLKRLGTAGKISFVLSVIVVCLAVYSFH